MAKWSPKKDPHKGREAEKYDNPVPSREFIVEYLNENNEPTTLAEFVAAFGLVDDEERKEALRRRLRAMIRDGQLMRNRKGAYGLVTKMDLILGRVIGHRDGFGFLAPDAGGDDLYLSSREMRRVFDGDKALARISGVDRKGRKEGTIVEVTERKTDALVGRFYDKSGVFYVVSDNKRICQNIAIPASATAGAKDGQFVGIKITVQPDLQMQPQAEVTEVLGNHMAPGMEIDVAMRSHDIPHEWPQAVVEEAGILPSEVEDADKKHRVDLRDLPLVTIDGEDARDFDDAVYCEKKSSGGWRLLVAIADVSHYVRVGSGLDLEAERRGTSVYFPERVIPMLPEALSNGLCSINPDVDRLCMVCEMSINAKGKMTRYKFFEGLMRSHARLTYTQVGALIEAKKNKSDTPPLFKDQFAHVEVPVLRLYELFKCLSSQRAERGTIDFDTTETRIIFSDDKKIENIIPVTRNDAHRLIEECMLCANVAAAKVLQKHKLPTLYRVHPRPKDEKLIKLKAFLRGLALELGGGEKPEPKDFQALLQSVAERPDFSIIQTVMLRSLSQAIYTPENEGHFGLAYDAYAHFTSPIRRYPDLLVHRALRYLIRTEKDSPNVERVPGSKRAAKKDWIPHSLESMIVMGEHCSMTERRADDATRDVVDWLKCEYMVDRVGDSFDGVVSSVTAFGLFVELKGIYVEGLVHVTSLKNDYYHFDGERHVLKGERSGVQYGLGDPIVVQVVRVNLDDRKIDFELSGDALGSDVSSNNISSNNVSGSSAKQSKKKNKNKSKKKGKKDNVGESSSADNVSQSHSAKKIDRSSKAKPFDKSSESASNSIWGQAKEKLSRKLQGQTNVDEVTNEDFDAQASSSSQNAEQLKTSEKKARYVTSKKTPKDKKGGQKRSEKTAIKNKKIKKKKIEAANKKRSRVNKDKGKPKVS